MLLSQPRLTQNHFSNSLFYFLIINKNNYNNIHNQHLQQLHNNDRRWQHCPNYGHALQFTEQRLVCDGVCVPVSILVLTTLLRQKYVHNVNHQISISIIWSCRKDRIVCAVFIRTSHPCLHTCCAFKCNRIYFISEWKQNCVDLEKISYY